MKWQQQITARRPASRCAALPDCPEEGTLRRRGLHPEACSRERMLTDKIGCLRGRNGEEHTRDYD